MMSHLQLLTASDGGQHIAFCYHRQHYQQVQYSWWQDTLESSTVAR